MGYLIVKIGDNIAVKRTAKWSSPGKIPMNPGEQAAGFLVVLLLVFATAPAISATPAGSLPVSGASSSGAADGLSCGCACAPRTATAIPNTAAGPGTLPDAAEPAKRITAGGIRRIFPKNVLDHPNRAAISALIASSPGISTRGIAAHLALNRETLRYHLAVLVSCRAAIPVHTGKTTYYFENHGKYSARERALIIHRHNRTTAAILALIGSEPGITGAALAGKLGLSLPTVRWHLQRLADSGILTGVSSGRSTGWYIQREGTEHAVIQSRVSPAAEAA